MFHETSHLNKHGFFEVGGEKFYSKLDAIKYSISTNQIVSWNFNNKIFSQLDWRTEPEQDLRSMYRERAQWIRDNYDYVVVMFSGGADSTTVIDSFVDNNILIDEIYLHHWSNGTGEGQNSFYNSEVFNSAIPYLKSKNINAGNTLIRIHDHSDEMRRLIKDPDFRERSMREVNNVHTLGTISWWYNLHLRFPEYLENHNRGKKVVFVWGEAKPRIDYDPEKRAHYFYFEDHYPHAPQPRDQEANDERCNHEEFYDDPNFPLIKVKQAHRVFSAMKQINHRSDIFFDWDEVHKDFTGARGFSIVHPRSVNAKFCHKNKMYGIDRNAFHAAIYPDFDILTYHEDKQKYRIGHPAYTWLEKSEPEASRAWYRVYIDTYCRLPDEWSKYYGDIRKFGIKRLKIPYYIE